MSGEMSRGKMSEAKCPRPMFYTSEVKCYVETLKKPHPMLHSTVSPSLLTTLESTPWAFSLDDPLEFRAELPSLTLSPSSPICSRTKQTPHNRVTIMFKALFSTPQAHSSLHQSHEPPHRPASLLQWHKLHHVMNTSDIVDHRHQTRHRNLCDRNGFVCYRPVIFYQSPILHRRRKQLK